MSLGSWLVAACMVALIAYIALLLLLTGFHKLISLDRGHGVRTWLKTLGAAEVVLGFAITQSSWQPWASFAALGMFATFLLVRIRSLQTRSHCGCYGDVPIIEDRAAAVGTAFLWLVMVAAIALNCTYNWIRIGQGAALFLGVSYVAVLCALTGRRIVGSRLAWARRPSAIQEERYA